MIANLDDATLTLKKGESRDLQVPGAGTLPKDKKNVSYKYVRTEVNGKETNSVNSEQKESAAVFYYDKITAVTLKQEAADTDGKRIEKLDDLKAELKGSEAKELKAPEAKKFDTEDAEQKITYTYEKTLVDGKEASKVTAADDGKTITYVYKKTAADKKTTVTLKQEAVDTDGNRIKKLDALTLELKKDEKKTLKAPDAKSLLNDRDSDVTYTFEKILVDGKEKDTVTAKDDGKTIQYVYKKEAVAKIIKTVHVVAVDDTEDHKKIADLGEKELTFHGKDDAITLAKIQPDTDRFTKKDEDYSYEYVYSYAELNGEKTAKVTAEDLTKDSTLTFVYQVKKTELPVTRTVKLVIRDTDGNAIKTFARVGVAFESSKAKRTADSFESYAKDVEELKETEDCRYEFKEARLNGKVFEEISAKDVTAGDTLTLVYEKVDKKVAVKITATAVDENGKTIAGHAKKELPDFDHVLTLDDPEEAPLSIDGYAYVDAKIDNTVITSLKKEKVDGAEDEDDSFAWSYVADGKTVDIEEDTDITLEYQAQKAVALNVTYVDEFGDPIGEDYKDLALDGDRFDEKNILKLEAGEDKPLQETIQVAQDESGKKIIQYTFEDAFIKVGLEKTEITAIQRTKISGSDENSNGAKYAYAVRYEGSDDFTDLDEDTTVYLQYNGGRKRLYTYEDDSVKVTAILQHADAIPDDAEFVVTPITKDSSDYNYAAYMQALNDNADKLSDDAAAADSKDDTFTDENTLLYDIAFIGHPTDEDGNIDENKTIEYQPAEGYVRIAVEFKKNQLKEDLGADEDQDVTVAHLPLKDAIKVANDTTKDALDIAASDVIVEAVDEVNASIDTGIASFNTSSFSVFAYVVESPKYGGDWAGSQDIKYSDFMNELGVAGGVAIYANTFTKNQHIEGTIAVNHLISKDTQELVSGSRVTTYNMVSSVSVTKNVNVPVKNDTYFNFAFFDSKKNLSSGIYEVKIASGQRSGTTTVNIAQDGKAYRALKDQGIDLYLYEVDSSNQPIESGNKYNEYTVTYPDGQTIPAATSTLKNYIGSITMKDENTASVQAQFFGPKGVVTYFRDNKPSNTYNSDNMSLNILDKNGKAVLTLGQYKQNILENGASGGSDTYLKQLSNSQFESQSSLNKNLKENGYFSTLSSDLANALNGKHSDQDCFNVINIRSRNGSFTDDLQRLGYGDPQSNNDERNELIGDDSHYLLVNIDCTGCNSYNMGKMVIHNKDGENFDSLGSHIVFNFVQKSGDVFVPYTGTINLNTIVNGVIFAPRATVNQGATLNDTCDKRADVAALLP